MQGDYESLRLVKLNSERFFKQICVRYILQI